MNAAAIIPVKRFDDAKQRLAGTLSDSARRALVEAMLVDVLDAVSECEALESVVVVTGERAAVHAARERGFEIVPDPLDSGHSEAALLGIAAAIGHGVELCALLPGDCPLLEPPQVSEAVARMVPRSVAVIPDRHGTGTNGLLLWPPDAIEPAFGERSRARHEALAREADCRVTVERVQSLALDVDDPEDLGELATGLRVSPERAPHTAGALDAIEIGRRTRDRSA